MEHRLRKWLVEVLQWVEHHPGRAEDIADFILEKLVKGGEATTPPDTGT